MTSISTVAVFLSLAAMSQMAYGVEPEPAPATLKEHHHDAALARVSLQHQTAASIPGKDDKPELLEPHAETRESADVLPEVRSRDDNEQFTRMSCCP